MPQETKADALALVRPFDDARNVRHHERLAIVVVHDAQVGLQRRKRIVGNLGLGGADHRQQGGLARVRETDQTDIRQQLQL